MDSFREWLSDNLRYILLGLAVILVLIIVGFAVKLAVGSGKGGKQKETKNAVVETASGTDMETQKENQEPLKENDSAVLETVQKYYTAMSSQDMDTLETMVESLSDADRQKIQNSIIESYQNIAVYSKSGPIENSYVVYAYYEAKLRDIEELVPSLVCLYLKTREDGSMCVADGQTDEATTAYIEDMKQDADVQALIQRVNDAYQKIIENNEQLSSMLNEMAEPETEITIPDVSDSGVEANQAVQATDVLNVRADSREDAEKIGMLEIGEQVTRVRVLENGWAEIKYGEAVGYVLNEYLTEVSR